MNCFLWPRRAEERFSSHEPYKRNQALASEEEVRAALWECKPAVKAEFTAARQGKRPAITDAECSQMYGRLMFLHSEWTRLCPSRPFVFDCMRALLPCLAPILDQGNNKRRLVARERNAFFDRLHALQGGCCTPPASNPWTCTGGPALPSPTPHDGTSCPSPLGLKTGSPDPPAKHSHAGSGDLCLGLEQHWSWSWRRKGRARSRYPHEEPVLSDPLIPAG